MQGAYRQGRPLFSRCRGRPYSKQQAEEAKKQLEDANQQVEDAKLIEEELQRQSELVDELQKQNQFVE